MAAPMSGAGFPSSLSPWHMWGNQQLLTLRPNQFVTPEADFSNVTLLRASYGRPETWRFLFAVRFMAGPNCAPAEQAQVNLQFDLITGIGRSTIQIPGFWAQGFVWNGVNAPVGSFEWSNVAVTSQLHRVDQFIGQDITLVAKANFVTDIAAPTNVVLEVSAQIAPNVHVRPDWYQVDAEQQSVQFPGAEIGGR